MQIKENTSIHPGKISLGVGRYAPCTAGPTCCFLVRTRHKASRIHHSTLESTLATGTPAATSSENDAAFRQIDVQSESHSQSLVGNAAWPMQACPRTAECEDEDSTRVSPRSSSSRNRHHDLCEFQAERCSMQLYLRHSLFWW